MEQKLVLENFTIQPYALKEDEDDVLILLVKFKLSATEFSEFREFEKNIHFGDNKYFNVVYNTDNYAMRFGTVGYSVHEELYKVYAVLVQKEYDESEYRQRKRHLHEVKTINEEICISNLKIINERLLSLLHEKEVLTKDEINTISNISDEDNYIDRLDMYKVNDIDDYRF
ncbi:hypothetical protein [Evansella cellulosilytica]|uniref:Uncharacterized protein n=1 Tax=Evansella cellulosilytica (strain ATCC 21833 / DSM 2522 / FERM P-1141 / JCM 9156 / N-4) TaxID=649639 RepID=E6U1I4_EVAC2|nr:hypothetical protein [Evansella cellulosilytica]ADU30347.1 hypothetical protein Bcell_2086 [Evansella cellulosilytica DSM 2522]